MTLLKRGLYFPCRKGRKEPSVGKGQNWKEVATKDRAKIRLWRKHGYNLGIYCAGSGLVVFDIDLYKPGVSQEWEDFKKKYKVPSTLQVKTARGGLHIYFKADPTQKYKGVIKHNGFHLGEIKYEGYVLWPGSFLLQNKKRLMYEIV